MGQNKLCGDKISPLQCHNLERNYSIFLLDFLRLSRYAFCFPTKFILKIADIIYLCTMTIGMFFFSCFNVLQKQISLIEQINVNYMNVILMSLHIFTASRNLHMICACLF